GRTDPSAVGGWPHRASDGLPTSGILPLTPRPRRQDKQKTAAPTAEPCRPAERPPRPATLQDRLTRSRPPSLASRSQARLPARLESPHVSLCRRRPTTVTVTHTRCSGREEARALPVAQEGAQRASGHRTLRLLASLTIAAAFGGSGLPARPAAAATPMKVVIVVGPVGSATSNYIYNAKKLAAQARSYGAYVVELYSPHATWTRVKNAAQGANVLIYLGHGNGY